LIRIVLLICLFCVSVFGAKHTKIKNLWNTGPTTTNGKIDATEKSLSQASKKRKQLNRQLSKIAQSILKAEKENRRLAEVLKVLAKNKATNEEKYTVAKKKIDTYKERISTLDQTIKIQNAHFVSLMIDQFSLMLAMEKIGKKTIDSVVMQEVYRTYRMKSAEELRLLKSEIGKSLEKKKKTLGYQKKIKRSISKISKKREAYRKKKTQKEKLLKKLAADELAYRKSIEALMHKQSMIRATLAKLHIIRQEEVMKERALEKERQAEIGRRASARKAVRDGGTQGHVSAKSFENTAAVKQVGSSYHRNKTYRYRGAKTISPLKHAKVVKSFGTYVDPIYKMKIFNESITLRAPSRDAKVRTVLNGKVVFAGQNSMLGKVIVVAHGGKMHTVYAGLSRISPLIKVGSRVKKGAVIGKVKRKLIFEATKDSKYINPVRLIRL